MSLFLVINHAFSLAQEPQASGIPFWVWLILGIVLLAIVLGLVLGSRTAAQEDDNTMRSTTVTDAPVAIPQTGTVVEKAPTRTTSDGGAQIYSTNVETPGVESSESVLNSHDLTMINGIGPGIQKVLNDAGIYTFDQLARSTPEDLRTIIRMSGLRSDDPANWPEQARLAAEGKWDDMKRAS